MNNVIIHYIFIYLVLTYRELHDFHSRTHTPRHDVPTDNKRISTRAASWNPGPVAGNLDVFGWATGYHGWRIDRTMEKKPSVFWMNWHDAWEIHRTCDVHLPQIHEFWSFGGQVPLVYTPRDPKGRGLCCTQIVQLWYRFQQTSKKYVMVGESQKVETHHRTIYNSPSTV